VIVENIETVVSRALAEFTDPDGAVVPAIQPATTYERGSDHQLKGDFIYRRNSSPTVALGERALATIDGGVEALVFSSGMAAVTAFSLALPRGSKVVAPRVMYHGAQDWFRRLDQRGDIELKLFDRIDSKGLKEALSDRADLVWIESPVNPTWEVIDIRKACTAAREAGAKIVVDSTVAPPVTTRPLELGADFVFHSATKYLNGHSDVTAGVLVARENGPYWEEVKSLRVALGSAPSPFDVWLVMRGLKTLAVRYRRASDTALALAIAFQDHPDVEAVLYPGLESNKQHEVARSQMKGGYGGMLSILVAGTADQARSVATGTTLFTTATSLGGTESLIEHRASVEGPHSVVPPNLLRLSIGLESPDDLIEDLREAFGMAFKSGSQ
jgi:cystathionine gamma-synthase